MTLPCSTPEARTRFLRSTFLSEEVPRLSISTAEAAHTKKPVGGREAVTQFEESQGGFGRGLGSRVAACSRGAYAEDGPRTPVEAAAEGARAVYRRDIYQVEE